jgi:endonuclease/exonuclease/phosphatase (EEP) superfamily protein YafD
MRVLSFNCRGLANPSKKLSLRRLVELNSSEVILLQETLGDSATVVKALESLFPGWMFAAVDARGHLGAWPLGGRKRTAIWKVSGGLLQVLV